MIFRFFKCNFKYTRKKMNEKLVTLVSCSYCKTYLPQPKAQIHKKGPTRSGHPE